MIRGKKMAGTGSHSHTVGCHIAFDILHGIINRHTCRHTSAGTVDVKLDILLRVLGFQKQKLILAENTGRDYDVIAADTERDNWMTAEEAKEYGLIDRIYTKRTDSQNP